MASNVKPLSLADPVPHFEGAGFIRIFQRKLSHVSVNDSQTGVGESKIGIKFYRFFEIGNGSKFIILVSFRFAAGVSVKRLQRRSSGLVQRLVEFLHRSQRVT